jgi:CHASE2 domain-containing sensor protein
VIYKKCNETLIALLAACFLAVSAIDLQMAPWLPPYVPPYVLLTCNALTMLYVRPAALPSLLLLLLMPPQLHPALHDMMMH